jgi:hypothetical protein
MMNNAPEGTTNDAEICPVAVFNVHDDVVTALELMSVGAEGAISQPVSVDRKPVPLIVMVDPRELPKGGEPVGELSVIAGSTVKALESVDGSPWTPVTVSS